MTELSPRDRHLAACALDVVLSTYAMIGDLIDPSQQLSPENLRDLRELRTRLAEPEPERCNWCGATPEEATLSLGKYEDAGTVLECANESMCHARVDQRAVAAHDPRGEADR